MKSDNAVNPSIRPSHAEPLKSPTYKTDSTIREYYSDTYKFKSEAKVLYVIRPVHPPNQDPDPKKGLFTIVLDKTIFHPQGGGQPADKGTITTEDGANFYICELKERDGVVLHLGRYAEGSPPIENGALV